MTTALQLVQRVQRKLRLPVSETVHTTHGRLILEYLNTVQRSILPDMCVWDNLKLYGEIALVPSMSIYLIEGIDSGEVEQILEIRLEGEASPLTQLANENFLEMAAIYGQSTGKPLYYRVYSRASNGIKIEVLPVPDASYTAKVEALCLPLPLENDTDEPVLDPDVIYLGAVVLAKSDMGLDYSTDNAVFLAKAAGLRESQGCSNWGDVEIV